MRQAALIVAFSVFIGVGALVLVAGILQIVRTKSNDRREFVEAILEKCELQDSFFDSSTVYSVIVSFRYEVKGVDYKSTKLADGYSASSDEHFHRELFSRLRESSKLKAWYSSGHPENAVLTKSSYGFGHHLAILGSMFVVLSVGCLTMTWLSSKASIELLENLEVPDSAIHRPE